VLWLRARVKMLHALAVAAGFAGVLLVIQPGVDGLNAWAWLCLLGTVLHAVRDLLTQRVPHEVPSIAVTLSNALAVTLAAGALSLVQGWQPMGTLQLALLAAAAVFLCVGYQFLIQAMRSGGDIALIAPFRYTGLLMAVALGWLVWGDVPNSLAWGGIALVVATGLYLLRSRHV
jgi:drug/metabolite transporter (DMT)-like permease